MLEVNSNSLTITLMHLNYYWRNWSHLEWRKSLANTPVRSEIRLFLVITRLIRLWFFSPVSSLTSLHSRLTSELRSPHSPVTVASLGTFLVQCSLRRSSDIVLASSPRCTKMTDRFPDTRRQCSLTPASVSSEVITDHRAASPSSKGGTWSEAVTTAMLSSKAEVRCH